MGNETVRVPEPPPWLAGVLSATAGAVDAVCFLALGGLFVAHITGDIVIVIVHNVTGGFSRTGPLLALPVFVSVLAAAVLAGGAVAHPVYNRRGLFLAQAVILLTCLGLAVHSGPFTDPDHPRAVLVGMLAVAAMATQTAAVRLTLPSMPATAVLTMNVAQLTVDLTALALGTGTPDDRSRNRHRARLTFACVTGFVVGCAAGAALALRFGLPALALPVALSVLTIPLSERLDREREHRAKP